MNVSIRWRWLAQPFFVVALGLLAVNDHVLKAHWPSWWTGKLSDVAGVVVVGTVASVVLGRRLGLIVAGVAFAVLKTVPGAQVIAAPFLGGQTIQDPTDLIALLVLVPLAGLLRRLDNQHTECPPRCGDIRRSISALAAVVVPVVASLATIFTATATSCASRPVVAEIDVVGANFFALVDSGYGEPKWARSADGGLTWQKSSAQPGRHPRASDTYGDTSGRPNGPLQSCTSDRTCFRVADRRRSIEQRSPNGTWTVERRLTADEVTGSESGCFGGGHGTLGSIGAAGSGSEVHAVASLGANGVLVRTDHGTWIRRSVLSARPTFDTGVPSQALELGLVVMLLTGVGLGLYGRHRWPSRMNGMLVFIVGMVTSVSVLGLFEFFLNSDGHEIGLSPLAAGVTLIIWVATVGLSIVVARKRKPDLPLWMLPPPPHPETPA